MKNGLDDLSKFVEGMPVGIASADTTGKTPNRFNAYFLKMFGWDTSDIDTMDKWFNNAYPDEEYRVHIVGVWEDAIKETIAKNMEYSEPIEAKVTCKDGSFKWCEVTYYGKDNFVYGIFTDVSSRKVIEEQLRELSLVDPLTKIYNRRYFNNKFYEMWNLSRRNKTPISLIICDIDDFKEINDTYGHLVGDQVLCTIASNISSALKRSTDFVVRYGGEEFAIILYGTDSKAALGVCKEIQENLINVDYKELKEDINCTLSYGIYSIVASDSITPEKFINNADKALYMAKDNGKNCIIVKED